jgi:hypothetical protein
MKLCIHMYFYVFELEWPPKITTHLTSFVKHICNTCQLTSNDFFFFFCRLENSTYCLETSLQTNGQRCYCAQNCFVIPG